MKRREFIKTTAKVGATLYASPQLFGMEQFKADLYPTKECKDLKHYHLTCPRNCRDAYALIACVKDGKMTGITGDKITP